MNRSERRRMQRRAGAVVPPGGPSGPAETPVAALQQAIALQRSGRAAEAEALLSRLLQTHPNDPDVLQLLGLAKAKRGALDDAVTLFQRSLNANPRQAHVHNNLGNVRRKQKKLQEAEACYRSALRLKPDYTEAHFNLGVALAEQDRHEQAAASYQAALKLKPDYVQALSGLGAALRECERFEEAVDAYRGALSRRPDYAEAHHSLGLTLYRMEKHEEALAAFREAQRLGLDSYQLHHNLANVFNVLNKAEEAIAGYRAAIRRNPNYVESHVNLNNLLWEHGHTEAHLRSYEEVLAKSPQAAALCAPYASVLLRQERLHEAHSALRRSLAAVPDEPYLHHLLAQCLNGLGHLNEAVREFEECIRLFPDNVDFRVTYGRFLLQRDNPERALIHLDAAVRMVPYHQMALAYQGLAWRLLDDPREHWLHDYENFVRPYELPVPEGYADLQSFLAELTQTLDALHTAKNEPTFQTLRNGTQTAGSIFGRAEPVIAAFEASLRRCIADYASRLPDDPEHPLASRRRPDFEFSGSWSVRLRRSGYHTMHMHPMGWLSSAFYVQLPEIVHTGTDKAGWIKFGQPDINLGEAGRARRYIQPREGTLVLFPSYMWHGTVPFETDDTRMTVAFDVVPKPDPAKNAAVARAKPN